MAIGGEGIWPSPTYQARLVPLALKPTWPFPWSRVKAIVSKKLM